jgi:glutamate-1-semialdehyde 2,1-aminomutase
LLPSERIAHSKITKKFRSGDKQLLFARGSGGTVWDVDGTEYVDFVMGYGPVVIGHAVEAFDRAVTERLRNGVMMPGYSVFHEQYLDRLLADRPGDRGAFFKTASEAVTAAFRLASMESGKVGVIRSGYVGWHDSQIANSLKWHEPLHSPFRDRLRYTDAMRGVGVNEPVLNWVDLQLESLRLLLDEHGDRLGCFVFDAYLASFTSVEVLAEAVRMCRDAGLLVVFDETKTGGRISPLGYAHDHALPVDLIVIGKCLANGLPISVLVGDAELLAHAERARLSGTFSKEMVTVYGAMATREILEEPVGESVDGWAELARVGARIASVMSHAADDAGVGKRVWAQPVFGGGMFELVYGPDLLGDKDGRDGLLRALAAHGVLLLEGHPSFVCLAHGELNWDKLQDQTSTAFSAWATANGDGSE